MIRRFHERFGLVVRDTPAASIPPSERQLRDELLLEEVAELVCARWQLPDAGVLAEAFRTVLRGHAAAHAPAQGPELFDVAREAVDVYAVLLGDALHYGFDLDAAARVVIAAHMNRIPNPPGKPSKPEGWEPPDMHEAVGLSEEYLRCDECRTILPLAVTPMGPCDSCGGNLVVERTVARRPWFEVVPVEGEAYEGRQWGYLVKQDGVPVVHAKTGGTGECWNLEALYTVGGDDADVLHVCDLDAFVAALDALRDSPAHEAHVARWAS